MSIQMSFKKDNGSIKLESITDDGKTLDIAAYKDKGLLTIGADGKYTGISAETSASLLSKNEMIENTLEENTETSNDLDSGSNELTTQELDIPTGEEKTANSMNTLEKACKDLELEPGCEKDKTTYTKKYRALAQKYHPDKCADDLKPCEPMFQKINAANEKLNNYNFENSEPRVSENNEASNQEANTKRSEIENQPTQNTLSTVLSFANKLQNNTSNLLKNVPLPSQNNLLQVATIPKGGKTKRMKAGKKNKSKRVRFMSKRNRRR